MIDLILPEERLGFAASLMQMHQDRKRVFVDQLGWDLPVRGSWLEVDAFDNEFAVYLIARSASVGRHEGSMRLLPTTRPNMLERLFADLCAGPVPKGEGIWEVSRFVTSPEGGRGRSLIRLYRSLALALLEFGVMNGIRAFTLVIEAARLPALLSVGWSPVPLGMPRRIDGQELLALRIDVDPLDVASMRRRLRATLPMLRVPSDTRKAA